VPLRSVPGSYWPFRSFPVAADATDPELVALLTRGRKALGPAWRIGPVNADDPTAARLVRLASFGGWSVLQRRVATSFVLDILAARKDGPWPRNSTLKKNRFHEKHLAEHGALEWRMVSGEEWSERVLDDLAAIERRAWVGQQAGANTKFLDPAQRRLWEQAVADPVLGRMLTTGLLYVGGEPAAFSFGLDAGHVRYCIATSYDERLAKHSPGKVLTYRTLIEAAERGITFLDDGAGDGGHKSTMGAAPGPDIMDYLFVRRPLAPLLRPFWK
jgi:CelD/BcsL family acetyltransferase involved in cellulose biosynthesis